MKLGEKAVNQIGSKDAVHVPIMVVASDESILPGENVKFADATNGKVVRCVVAERHGVADPFVPSIQKGEPFLMLLRPNLTGTLTHHFELLGVDVAAVAVAVAAVPVHDYENDADTAWDNHSTGICPGQTGINC